MFFGSFLHSLDEKGRLVIPRKMREEIGVKVYILKGYDGALSIFKASAFEQLCKEINTLPFNKKDSRAFLRIQLANACEIDVDKAGRIQIPSQLLTRYQIGKDVIVLGVLDHIEVWDVKTYEQYEKDSESNFEEIAEHLSDKEN